MRIFLWICWLGLLALAAETDRRTRTIPDGLIACLFAVGIVSAAWMPETGPAERLLGAVAVSAPMFFLDLIRPGAFGGGDVKLMAAGGVMLGAQGIWLAFCLALLPGGIYSLFLLISGRGRKSVFAFGPFLCAGMAAAWALNGFFP
ncbi:MAG TPA: A24 family peptidase [Candidatus Eisenbergiella merdigallinarum]|uniref:A24 family peptidase n=1 Tax=Candidatus Eisenbergiella merdigallinarum TaxID=2838552 RepID=A0A9D2MQS3_9FIRM|nr:A24 family peptidase [Candidatus Eisenbergiella merdigallinarum]